MLEGTQEEMEQSFISKLETKTRSDFVLSAMTEFVVPVSCDQKFLSSSVRCFWRSIANLSFFLLISDSLFSAAVGL